MCIHACKQYNIHVCMYIILLRDIRSESLESLFCENEMIYNKVGNVHIT